MRRRPRAVPHVWSAVHTDPPCVLPPCHVSLFDTLLSSCIEFVSFFASTHFLFFFSFVPFLGLDFSSFSSLPLSTHFFLLLFLSPSLLVLAHLAALVPPALFSAPLAPPALSSASSRASCALFCFFTRPPALFFLPLLSFRVRFLLTALNRVVSRSSAPLARSLALSLSLSLVLSLLPPSFRRSHSQPISSFWSLSFLGPTWPGGVSHQPPCYAPLNPAALPVFLPPSLHHLNQLSHIFPVILLNFIHH